MRYDHGKNCPGQPIVRDAIPVKRRAPVKDKKPEVEVIPDDIVEQEVKKRIQNIAQERLHARLKVKEERIKKLSAHIA